MDDDPEAWMRATKRRGALRVLVIGLALLVAGGAWALHYWGWAVGGSPLTYTRVVAVLVLGIGGSLAIAGGVMLARVRRIEPPLPVARKLES